MTEFKAEREKLLAAIEQRLHGHDVAWLCPCRSCRVFIQARDFIAGGAAKSVPVIPACASCGGAHQACQVAPEGMYEEAVRAVRKVLDYCEHPEGHDCGRYTFHYLDPARVVALIRGQVLASTTSVPVIPEPADVEERIPRVPPKDEIGVRVPASAHSTVPVLVWVDVDIGVAKWVRLLNSLPGVRTFASCQGTESYCAYIMVSFVDDKARARIERDFILEDVGMGNSNTFHAHPKSCFPCLASTAVSEPEGAEK